MGIVTGIGFFILLHNAKISGHLLPPLDFLVRQIFNYF